jgi:DUF2075 family protein/DNA replication protein DnaC
MAQIETFSFERNKFDQIRSYSFGRNWPVVYLIENGKEIYIGETTNAYGRSNQHYENPERQRLERIHIITDGEYNKSATLDIESSLIQYMSAEETFVLQNGNHGLLNHNYYDRQKYQAKFEVIWQQLKEMSLVKKDLVQIKNSDLFKYSPYKALTEDQLNVVSKLLLEIKANQKKAFIIKGGPGTGKTILATYLIKALKELKETKNLEVALVIPMTSLRKTIKKVFKNVKGLSSKMVIGPNEVINKKYDVLIVDEAHRLKQRKNITNYQSFDKTNQKLGLDNSGTELDWIMKSSRYQILFYDINQNVRPSDVDHRKFLQLEAMELELKTQLRIGKGDDGEKYINFIQDLFDLQSTTNDKFYQYDFKIYDDIHKMVADIKQKDREIGLGRIVSGYAWPWVSKKNPEKHDIEIDGIKLFWNSINHNWVNSKNAIDEVGCIHTVQGYDLNYTGVIIGPELSYDDVKGEFVVYADKYMDSNGKRGVDNPQELERYIINIYKTLLTRGIDGTYVFIVDENLREYFKSKIGIPQKKLEVKSFIMPSHNVEMIKVPLFESVGCGDLMFADSTIQEMIPIESKLMSKGSKYFVLRISGDSMNKAGINDGDLVLCKKDYHPREGSNVVALIGDNATIKELHFENGTIVLKPCSSNLEYKPLIFINEEEIKIQGVVVRVLNRLEY